MPCYDLPARKGPYFVPIRRTWQHRFMPSSNKRCTIPSPRRFCPGIAGSHPGRHRPFPDRAGKWRNPDLPRTSETYPCLPLTHR